MKRRTKIFAALALFLALTTGLAVGWQYYPHAVTVEGCFARNGLAVGEVGDCEGMGRAIAEINMGASLDVDWGKACHKRCQDEKQCSFYVIRAPSSSRGEFYLLGPPGYQCKLFK